MADSKSAQWSTLLSYSSGITLGGQSSSEDYAVGLTKSLPSGTGGASFWVRGILMIMLEQLGLLTIVAT